MNEFTKNLIKTTAVLMLIAGTSALLVGAVNAFTAPVIEQNNIQKEKEMLAEVYGDDADTYVEWSSSTDATSYPIENSNGVYFESIASQLSYVTKVWTAKKGTTDIGYIVRFYGKNGYGEVDMLVGISLEGDLGDLCIISDTMSYKSKLEGEFIDPYNEADDKEDALSDSAVKCGATFAAKIVRGGILEARQVVNKEISSTSMITTDINTTVMCETPTLSYTLVEKGR